jgi:hypothetical protein
MLRPTGTDEAGCDYHLTKPIEAETVKGNLPWGI